MYRRVVEKQLIQKPRDTVEYEELVKAGADAIKTAGNVKTSESPIRRHISPHISSLPI
jgi:hypothetical protein